MGAVIALGCMAANAAAPAREQDRRPRPSPAERAAERAREQDRRPRPSPTERAAERARARRYAGVPACDYRYLLLAAQDGDCERIQKSLRSLNPMEVRDNGGNTPLHAAALYGHTLACIQLIRCEPAVVQAVNERGDTALHLAAAGPSYDPATEGRMVAVVRTLLELGADANIRNAQGKLPLDLASNGRVRRALQTGPTAATRRLYDERLAQLLGCSDREAADALLPSDLPAHLLCPITHAPMVDPVDTADGQTYEHHAILQWLADHETSPLTGLALASKTLTPNDARREEVERELKRWQASSAVSA